MVEWLDHSCQGSNHAMDKPKWETWRTLPCLVGFLGVLLFPLPIHSITATCHLTHPPGRPERQARPSGRARGSCDVGPAPVSGGKLQQVDFHFPVYLQAVAVVPAPSDAEAAKLVRRGDSRRCVAAGAPYPSSHVAHSVVTVHVESRSLVRSAPTTARAKLHLVDMAGVNLVTKRAAAWLDHRQISGANLDRLLLGRYLDKLRGTPSTACSRTSSTLIHYLGDSLHPTSMLRFIGHVIPDVGNLDSTLSTLRFGERARGLPPRLLRFKAEPQLEGLLQNVQERLTQTKKDLEIARMLTNLPACGYTSQDYANFTGQFIEKFERGEIDAHALLTNVDPKITLQVFKDLHTRCVEEKQALEQRTAECEEGLLAAQAAARTALESGSPRPSLASRSAARRSTGAKRTSQAEPRAVGDSTKSGISIGPGLASEFEGPATRDMKHKKVIGSLKEKPIRKKR